MQQYWQVASVTTKGIFLFPIQYNATALLVARTFQWVSTYKL